MRTFTTSETLSLPLKDTTDSGKNPELTGAEGPNQPVAPAAAISTYHRPHNTHPEREPTTQPHSAFFV